jgi:hypothetical protein
MELSTKGVNAKTNHFVHASLLQVLEFFLGLCEYKDISLFSFLQTLPFLFSEKILFAQNLEEATKQAKTFLYEKQSNVTCHQDALHSFLRKAQ